jgi:predicted transcriptional regulator
MSESRAFEDADRELREWMRKRAFPKAYIQSIADAAREIYSRHALDRAEVVRVLREYIDKSYGIRMEWGVEAREHVEELAHRLGLAGELGAREG